MPWCEDCTKFWSPNSMPPTGKCPTCGLQLAEPQEEGWELDVPKPPWHFKLMVAALAVYLAWRVVQLLQWMI
jgi:hypothetical protein